MQIVQGDILQSKANIIVQQVNTLGLMGSGLAKHILLRYPEVKIEYRKFCKQAGRTPQARQQLLGQVQFVHTSDGTIVANVFGQLDIRKNAWDSHMYTNTTALILGITAVREFAEEYQYSVAIPFQIGCGLANGNWEEIKPLIESVFADSSVQATFYQI